VGPRVAPGLRGLAAQKTKASLGLGDLLMAVGRSGDGF